ncbi:MAG: DUF899 family protein, partial [Pseudonocardia sp.]|nr:DUF899 family protein [Pseudonocardia sp.]
TMVCASRAPLSRLDAYRRRMGWGFEWVSSLSSDFNQDFGVSFPGARRGDVIEHNFQRRPAIGEEHGGLSAFALDNGVVYHTYSCYSRGLDAINGAYQLLDRAPRGRDEDALPVTIAWLRRHDEYDRIAASS